MRKTFHKLYPLLKDNYEVIKNDLKKDEDKKNLDNLVKAMDEIEENCKKLSDLPGWVKYPGKKLIGFLDGFGAKKLQKELNNLK